MPFDELTVQNPYPGDAYVTPERTVPALAQCWPSLYFYWHMAMVVKTAAGLAKRGVYTDADWIRSSLGIAAALEGAGGSIFIEGLEHFKTLDGPCVFIGNHMSTLETFLLPGMIQPCTPVTFVVKQSLLDYPIFKHVMRARTPVAVARKNPRDDLAAVMDGGCERLSRGISVIIFPQSTRNTRLDPQQFNSMGVKLARRAGVPIIPVALRTDAWGMGGIFGLFKDYGRIRPDLPARFRFGPAMTVTGNGKEEHAVVYEFIRAALGEWGLESPPLG